MSNLDRIERIDFQEVRKEIKKFFPDASLENWELIPDSIYKLAESERTKLVWKAILNWEDFEYGRADISEKEFIDLGFYQTKPKGQIYLVTDKCFEENKAYSLDSERLEHFAENIYPKEQQEGFVQPQDYIFVNPQQRLITLIHHEGQVLQYQRRN